jgi:hypothetical protein
MIAVASVNAAQDFQVARELIARCSQPGIAQLSDTATALRKALDTPG